MGIFNRMQGEIEAREKQEGITPADLLDLSDDLRKLINKITRDGEMSAKEAAEILGSSPENARETLDALVEKGYLEREERKDEGWIYSVRFARKRARNIPVGIWSALGQRAEQEEDKQEEE